MAVTNVVFANVSSLTVSGTTIDTAQSFQASRGAENKPIFAFGSDEPVLSVSSQTNGTIAATYIIKDASAAPNFKDGKGITITVSGVTYPDLSAQTLSFTGCTFAGQSLSMSTRGELVCSVNFGFISGTF